MTAVKFHINGDIFLSLFLTLVAQMGPPGWGQKLNHFCILSYQAPCLTLLHSEWPKLRRVLAILSAIGLNVRAGIKYGK